MSVLRSKEMNNLLLIPVSPGDVLDRLSILQIKYDNSHLDHQKKIIKTETELLEKAWHDCFGENPKNRMEFADLLLINSELWKLEDNVRALEKLQAFKEDFINTARKIYLTNDKRAHLKESINKTLKSVIYDIKIFNSTCKKGDL